MKSKTKSKVRVQKSKIDELNSKIEALTIEQVGYYASIHVLNFKVEKIEEEKNRIKDFIEEFENKKNRFTVNGFEYKNKNKVKRPKKIKGLKTKLTRIIK